MNGEDLLTAPVAARRPHVHEAHGVRRPDDYAWMRDHADPELLSYLRAERAFYDRSTEHLAAARRALEAELVARTEAAHTSVRWRQAGAEWFTVTTPGQQHERLERVDPRTGVPRTALDVERLAMEGPGATGHAELGVALPSPDGRLLAYSVDTSGEEVFELRFRDLDTGADLPDVVRRSYYGGAWSADSSTFLYTVHDASYRPDTVWRHRIGTPVAQDERVLHEPDRRFELSVEPSDDGAWLLLTARSRDTTQVWLVDAREPDAPPRSVAERRPGIEYDVQPLAGGWDGAGDDALLVVTNDGFPEFGLALAPVPAAGGGTARDWAPVQPAPTGPDERLDGVRVLTGFVVLSLRSGGEPLLRVLDRAAPGDVHGPAASRDVRPGLPVGQLALWHLHEPGSREVVVVEQSLVVPPRWVRVDLATGHRVVVDETTVPGVDLGGYVTERLWATAPDGARVPVSVARRAGLEPGGSAGCLLYGYGAYEACWWPDFAVGTLALLDRDVVFALAHVRGGGELGRQWWQQGRLRGKQRTFDDFLAARDAVVDAGWAAPDAVVCRGLSAGGLLQGAVFSQRPQAWRAVVAEVPFVDVVTTMQDPSAPLTVGEWDEWGDPVRSPEDFAAMLAYSPYDNPPGPGRPALLVTGTLHDPRVMVSEPAKWVARLRASDDPAQPSPLLLRAELGEGAHTGPSGRYAQLHYEAEVLTWVLDRLGRLDGLDPAHL